MECNNLVSKSACYLSLYVGEFGTFKASFIFKIPNRITLQQRLNCK